MLALGFLKSLKGFTFPSNTCVQDTNGRPGSAVSFGLWTNRLPVTLCKLGTTYLRKSSVARVVRGTHTVFRTRCVYAVAATYM